MNAFVSLLNLFTLLAFCDSQSHTLNQSELHDKLKYYKNINTLHTQFKQLKKIKDLEIDLISEGELSLQFPDEITWTLKKPAYTQLRLTGQSITLESGEAPNRKTNTFDLSKELDPSISKSLVQMLAWLKIDVEAIFRMYEVIELSPKSYACKPRNTKEAVFEGLSFFLHSKGHIERLIISEKSGDSLMISFFDPKISLKK